MFRALLRSLGFRVTPLLDDLVVEGVLVDDNFASEGDIEILKGNSHQVSVMDGAKCVGSGRSGTE